ncbi:MAG: hypothetical protein RIR97_1333 [Pseudomonadota bacterium]
MRTSFCFSYWLLSIGLGLLPVTAHAQENVITSQPITQFKVGSAETVFGSLEFVGGITTRSDDPVFGAMSSIRFYPDATHFLAVLDTGYWASGKIERNVSGAINHISDIVITSMIDRNGNSNVSKGRMDAEGLAFREQQILVSYEFRHRIDIYPAESYRTSRPVSSLPILIPGNQLRSNGGLETLALSPGSGPLAGAAVTISEKSMNADGNLLAAVLEGPRKGIFALKRLPPYSATDATFLPNGDLLVLERRFGISDGIGMRLRRIKADAIKPGATIDGEVLLEAGAGYQIDNMEGIDALTGPDGSTRIILISDDNHSFFQRTLFLEFKLLK